MHHPVGKNPRILAKTSEIVRLKTTNRTAITDTKPRKRRPLRIRNISCKSVPNFCRPIETIYERKNLWSVKLLSVEGS